MVRPLAILRTAIAHGVRAVRRDGLGWLAVGLISRGVWDIYHPAGLIVLGVMILAGLFLQARGEHALAASPDAERPE